MAETPSKSSSTDAPPMIVRHHFSKTKSQTVFPYDPDERTSQDVTEFDPGVNDTTLEAPVRKTLNAGKAGFVVGIKIAGDPPVFDVF